MSEEINTIATADVQVICAACETNAGSEDAFCEKCGYPLKGTEEEQAEFKKQRVYKHLELDDMQTKVFKASNTLFVLSGIFALFGLVFYGIASPEQNPAAILVTNIVLSALFVGLGFWSRVQPVAGLISGLVLYGIVQVVNAIAEPSSIISGILVKVFIVIYLVKGLRSAFEAKKLKEQHNL